MAERDIALVNILERLANEMTRQDKMLEDLLLRQNELSKAMESAVLRLRGTQADSERSYDKLMETMSHYRSDMLSLVREQDNINQNIDELQNVLKTTTLTTDVTNKKILEIGERLSHLEKISGEHFEYASKQPEIYREAIKDSSRDFTRLHAETEKNLTLLHKDTENRLQDFQHETTRRLLLLDGIISSLQTLLVRTEPPEKKPPWIIRVFKSTGKFFGGLPHRIKQFFSKGEDN